MELKNGKLVFKQKALSFEKMSETMQGAEYFRCSSEWRVVTKLSLQRSSGLGKCLRTGFRPSSHH